jgi:hypothetical protein
MMLDRSQTAIASPPPNSDTITDYDRAHLVTYLKLLDAKAMNIDWGVIARNVLDIEADIETARRAYAAHLARARWMTQMGYCELRTKFL